MTAKAFLDSSVLVCLLTGDEGKADRTEQLLLAGAITGVQALNELTQIIRRQVRLSWPDIHEFLAMLRSFVHVEALSLLTHDQGLRLADRYGLPLPQAMHVASALLAECDVLYSQELQHGLLIDNRLRVCNPFIVRHDD